MSPQPTPARGVHLALRAWCSPREARIRAARVRYGRRWQEGDMRWLARWLLASRIIAERLP